MILSSWHASCPVVRQIGLTLYGWTVPTPVASCGRKPIPAGAISPAGAILPELLVSIKRFQDTDLGDSM